MVWGKKKKKPVEVAEPAADVAAPAVTPTVEEPTPVVEAAAAAPESPAPAAAPVADPAELLARLKVTVEEARKLVTPTDNQRSPRAGLRKSK